VSNEEKKIRDKSGKSSLSKDLNPMVLPVGDEYVTGGVDGDSLEALELGVVLAPPPEGAQECSVRVEDLNPVVAGI
jgi:hypothetical protein